MQALEVVKNPRASMKLQEYLMDAGMINIESRMMPIPLCPWSNGSYLYKTLFMLFDPALYDCCRVVLLM